MENKYREAPGRHFVGEALPGEVKLFAGFGTFFYRPDTSGKRVECGVIPSLKPEFKLHKRSLKDLRIACILDEFSYHAFKYEALFVQLSPENWREVMARESPDLLLVESAWKGREGKWQHKVGGIHLTDKGDPAPLISLVYWCRERGIPTVFWNKEDPVNFEHFIGAARLFDYVFTTDEGSVVRYRRLLSHDRIYVLPFAAQPRIHNPVDRGRERLGQVAFAGTWYNQKHPDRRVYLAMLLSPALAYDLAIYDRMYNSNNRNYAFPDEFRPFIKGFVPYRQMIDLYKKYDVFLNVNSISDSATMFSRRVFELLACGVPVISTYSRGIEMMFPGIVTLCRDEEEVRQALSRLLSDPELRDRLSLKGQRAVFGKHTLSHRLRHLLSSMGVEPPAEPEVGISVIAWARTVAEAENVLRNFLSQRYPHRQLLLLVSPAIARWLGREKKEPEAKITMIPLPGSVVRKRFLKLALEQAAYDNICFFEARDYYAPFYLTDFVNALLYTDSQVLSKVCHYELASGCKEPILSHPGMENTYAFEVNTRAMMISRSLFEFFLDESLEDPIIGIKKAVLSRRLSCYSIDRFNYLRGTGTNDGPDIREEKERVTV